MDKERWQLIERTYHAALEREGEARSAFLDEACAGDEELRREVEGLVSHDCPASSFIESPALEIAAREMANDPLDQEQSEISNSPAAPQRIGPYKLLAPLGRGGMGEVHLALDTRLNRKVAIKLLPAAFTTDAERLRRFEQEARAASALNHPNILTIYEIGQHDSLHFMVTEFIEGETLRQRITIARLTLQTVLEVGTQIASALGAAHDNGIVHRDIKPENIMLRPDGYVKVLDFGLAKLSERHAIATDTAAPTIASGRTLPGTVMGTIAYMSPEQARGLEVDGRTDIFSLGVVLYELVSGRAPFEGATISDLIVSILERDPLPLVRYWPEVPAELERIVAKALHKNREQRYQTAKGLQLELKSLAKETEIATKPEGLHPSEASRGRQTAETVSPRVTSSAEYIVTQLKGHRRGALIMLAILILAAASASFYFTRAPALTDKDTILLADFDNKTGDADFDGTLKQGLATQLQQSRFVHVFPEARVLQTLRQMERAPDTRITVEIAQEMCERQNLKAFIAGSIAPLGSHYILTLEAINGRSGDVLTRAQADAESKDQVLQALSQAATGLREKLGESLSSIQQSDKPLAQIIASDLRALKDYNASQDLSWMGRHVEALPFALRAVELDPQFAAAYDQLAIICFATGQPEAAAEYQARSFRLFEEKASRLKDSVSEFDKLDSTAWYHLLVTGNQIKQLEYLLLRRQLAPRFPPAHNDLGLNYNFIGQSEQALAPLNEAIHLNSNFAAPYKELARALIRLNRFAEAKVALTQALQLKLEMTEYHSQLYQLAFISGDAAGMQQQLDWARGKPDEYVALDWQTGAAAFAGKWGKAQELARRAIELAAHGDNLELAARYATEQALRNAALGDCRLAKADAAQGLARARGRIPLSRASLALALCAEPHQAKSLIDELTRRYPEDTVIHSIWLPAIRADLELQRGNAGKAIELLQTARLYEAAAEFWPGYVRGQAYLRLKSGREAVAEFQKILDHRGEAPLSALYPLAHLGLARASALAGDVAGSRKAYQDFLAIWKDADAGLPVLIAAKKEYQRLK
jgi:serine/threonine protein kinase/tetratricopeptide (TPR) repeat protein